MSPERIAPEQFGFKNSRPTIASDCYALGMVVYETISGNVPFHKEADLTVSMKVVVKGEHPPRGAKFTKRLWEMLELCWAPKPNHRPGIEDVLWCLEVVSNSSEPPSPVAEEGTDEEGDDWDSEPGSSGDDPFDPFAADDRVQLSPTVFLQDHHFINQARDPPRRGQGRQTTTDGMSDTPSNDTLDGSVKLKAFKPFPPEQVSDSGDVRLAMLSRLLHL